MTRTARVVCLLPGFLLAAGLGNAQTRLRISQVDSTGQITQTTFDPVANSLVNKAPTAGPNGTFKYWDGLSSTNFYNQPSYISAPPNPSIAVGPDDILTVVNRTIARYPNPNAAGNLGATNPYSNPPTHQAFLDAWTGINGGALNNLCPSAPQFGTCILDNVSIRYDQMQGRFVVLMTITDLEFHQSNWVLLVSRWANFACSTTGGGPASACPFTSDIFTPPIVANFGGPSIGGVNGNWIAYVIPINVFLSAPVPAGAAFCVSGVTGATGPTGTVPVGYGGTVASAPPGGGTSAWNNGPGNPMFTPTVGCSNYFPTGARFGLDNDNIILTAPVLDQTQTVFAGSGGMGLPGGAYAGTRIATVPKLVVYNGTALPLSSQPFPSFGAGMGAVNLADDTLTGTLTQVGTQVPGVTGAGPTLRSQIPPIFWEPDNLRGRALASYDAQVGVTASASGISVNVQGVITPIDYLVGTLIADFPGGVSSFSNFYVQPIVFSCPAGSIFAAPAGVTYCGTSGGAGTQVPDSPTLGVPSSGFSLARSNAGPLAHLGDPQLVGQGPATSTPGPLIGPTGILGFVGGQPRIFVGDSRPQQVIFREGLLYVARAAQIFGSGGDSLGTSTVVYDILKQAGPACQVNGNLGLGAPGPFCTVPTGTSQCPSSTTAGCASSPYASNGMTIPNPVTILETYWYNGTTPTPCPAITGYAGPGLGNTPGNPTEPLCDMNGYGFYAPAFDVPADVIGSLATTSQQPISPISLFPWLEKLFVGMTTGGTPNLAATFSTNNPSLWDYRPGDDLYDSSLPYLDPVNGAHLGTSNLPFLCAVYGNINNVFSPTAMCPVVPFGTRGGASTDPNDGSLWLYGAFAKKRFSQINSGPGQWGTSVANYALDFSALDPYNNDNQFFSDVQPGSNQFFTWIQIARNVGIATGKSSGPVFCPPGTGGNPGIVPPPTGNNGNGTTPAPSINCNIFGPTDVVNRSEMARWVVLAQMDEAQVTAYLNATGGAPGCADLKAAGQVGPGFSVSTCVNNTTGNAKASSFADPPVAASGSTAAYPGILDDPNLRYIETMYRRGYTKGCQSTLDTTRKYCPTDPVTRGQMAVFIIRAKMSNVFPTSLSGIALNGIYGDNFGTFLGVNPNGVAIGPNGAATTGQYFQDEPTSDGFFLYIQKMRELRITNGTGVNADPTHPCTTGPCYSPFLNITRQEVATFIVRAFFL